MGWRGAVRNRGKHQRHIVRELVIKVVEVAPGERVFRSDLVIDLEHCLPLAVITGDGIAKQSGRRLGGQGNQLLEHALRQRVDARDRDDVSGKWLAGQGVADGLRSRRKIATALCFGEHGGAQIRRTLALNPLLLGKEEERLIAPVIEMRDVNGAADSPAELGYELNRNCRGEEVAGIQRIISDKLEKAAVQRIGARARDSVHHRTRAAPYSALKLLVWTLNSWRASGLGIAMPALV